MDFENGKLITCLHDLVEREKERAGRGIGETLKRKRLTIHSNKNKGSTCGYRVFAMLCKLNTIPSTPPTAIWSSSPTTLHLTVPDPKTLVSLLSFVWLKKEDV